MCCSLKDNIKKFAEAEKLTLNEIAELADLTPDQLSKLELEKTDRTSLYAFCVHFKLDLGSIYSDNGFKGASLSDQYATYPNQLKKMISKLYCKQLIKQHCAGSEAQFKLILKPTKLGQPILTRILSGNSAFSPSDLDLVIRSMSSVVPEKDNKMLLAKTMFSLIPNYNLIQLHEYFKVSYPKIAQGLKVTASSVGNWGGTNCVPIPDAYWGPLAAKFGYGKFEFGTTVLDQSEFKKHSFVESELTKQPTKVKDDLNDTAVFKPNKKQKLEQGTIPAVSENLQIAGQPSAGLQVTVSNEIVQKMYKSLNTENLEKVNQLITDLFFKQLQNG